MTAPVAGTTLGSGEATPGLMRSDSLMTAVYKVNQYVYVIGKGVCIDRRRIMQLTRYGNFSNSSQLSGGPSRMGQAVSSSALILA